MTNDEFDLRSFFHILWKRWLTIAFTTCLAAILSVVFLHVATQTYTAELKSTAAQTSLQSRIGPNGGLGGLATLVGIQLPQDVGRTQYTLYLESVYSRSTADALAERQDLMHVIFKNEWNAQTQRWEQRESSLTPTIRAIKSVLGLTNYAWTPPDGGRLQVYLRDRIRITEDNRRSVTTLSYSHEDPAFAVTLLTALHETIDSELRQKMLARTGEYIDYLSRQLSRVTIAEYREALMQVLSEQEKLRMMASAGVPFAADQIGIPSASFRPTWPPGILVLFGFPLIGFFIGVLLVLFRHALR